MLHAAFLCTLRLPEHPSPTSMWHQHAARLSDKGSGAGQGPQVRQDVTPGDPQCLSHPHLTAQVQGGVSPQQVPLAAGGAKRSSRAAGVVSTTAGVSSSCSSNGFRVSVPMSDSTGCGWSVAARFNTLPDSAGPSTSTHTHPQRPLLSPNLAPHPLLSSPTHLQQAVVLCQQRACAGQAALHSWLGLGVAAAEGARVEPCSVAHPIQKVLLRAHTDVQILG
jgi:hypothetical protein